MVQTCEAGFSDSDSFLASIELPSRSACKTPATSGGREEKTSKRLIWPETVDFDASSDSLFGESVLNVSDILLAATEGSPGHNADAQRSKCASDSEKPVSASVTGTCRRVSSGRKKRAVSSRVISQSPPSGDVASDAGDGCGDGLAIFSQSQVPLESKVDNGARTEIPVDSRLLLDGVDASKSNETIEPKQDVLPSNQTPACRLLPSNRTPACQSVRDRIKRTLQGNAECVTPQNSRARTLQQGALAKALADAEKTTTVAPPSDDPFHNLPSRVWDLFREHRGIKRLYGTATVRNYIIVNCIYCGIIIIMIIERRCGLMVSAQVRQSKGPGFDSRSGQNAYFHGVKTRLSTLGTGDVPRGSDSTLK